MSRRRSISPSSVYYEMWTNIGTAEAPQTQPGHLDPAVCGPITAGMTYCMRDIELGSGNKADVKQILQNRHVFLARRLNGQIVGFLAWRKEAGEGREPPLIIRIRRLHVDPDARGLRIGNNLLGMLLYYALQAQLPIKVLAMKVQVQRPASEFFSRYNFKKFAYNHSGSDARRGDVDQVWLMPAAIPRQQIVTPPSTGWQSLSVIPPQQPAGEQRKKKKSKQTASRRARQEAAQQAPSPVAQPQPQPPRRSTAVQEEEQKCVVQ